MGKQRIVISEQDNIAALFDDDSAVEFIIHRGDVLLGDVYLAQVENILPSIDAGFVNVGTERMGFLHSSDVLGKGDLKSRLQPKQNLVVQVMKEPTGHKGPRVTQNIALPGRFLVMLPESKGISISRKILDNKERARLKSILSLIKPPGVGVIIRTEAENQSEPEIQEDFEILLERWQNIVAMADTVKPPLLLYRDQDLLYRVIRELVTEDVREIVVDTAFGQQRAQHLLQNWGIDQPIKVTLHQGPQNIMVGMGIDKEIKMALQTRVPLPSGGYLFIQTTEALTVVDVNSGKFTSNESQAETIRLTNLEAGKEIARQLRLRNIGGMIIVDFIDMESRANQLNVLQSFELELSTDKAKPQIGQLSDLGLVEMTRHRQGQSLAEIFTKKCHSCNGTGTALEDFNWAPSSQEVARGRSKMPVRKPQAQPAVAQHMPQGAVAGQAGAPAPGGQGNQRNVGRPGQSGLRKLLQPQTDALPVWESFINAAKRLEEKEQKAITDALGVDEIFKYRLSFAFGIRLASIVKVARLPIAINGIMIRINPHANDIFTLVDGIEGGGSVSAGAMSASLDSDDDDDDEGDDTGANDGDEASALLAGAAAALEDPTEEAPSRPSRGNNRNNRRGGGGGGRPQRGAVAEAPEVTNDGDDEDGDIAASAYAAAFMDGDDEPVRASSPRRRAGADLEDSDDDDGDEEEFTPTLAIDTDDDSIDADDDTDNDDDADDTADDDDEAEAAPARRGKPAAKPVNKGNNRRRPVKPAAAAKRDPDTVSVTE